MRIEFQEYEARKIVNVHKHVDGPWFWGKYTAHPYIGCRSGCEFCYVRGSRYLGRRDPETFDTVIQVKLNAVELLRQELERLEPNTIACGDWQQPAESRYRLSRRMLEVVLEFQFPLFVIERSPLLLRDLDLLDAINKSTYAGVMFSISSTDTVVKQAFEPHSPGVKRRFKAMEKLAAAGITVGTALMPIIPAVSDSTEQLEDVIRATKDHGGICVLAGGMTMDAAQAERVLQAARRFNPALESKWRDLYSWTDEQGPSFGPLKSYNTHIGLLVRELCDKHGILDRMPRYIPPGPLAINKRIAERLFLKTYDLELDQAQEYRIWAYRRAAWTVDEYEQSIAEVHRTNGTAGLQQLPAIGKRLAAVIADWLREENTTDN